jgi:DNA-binding transcriptional MocR family regulator
MIRGGSLRPGDRLPSVRALSRTRRVSPSTVLQAYDTLMAERLIEPKTRSGYYVLEHRAPTPVPRSPAARAHSTRVTVSDLVFDTLEASRDRGVIPLGSAFPGPAQFPWTQLARYLGSSARRMDPWNTVESLPPGSIDLRREIARRYLKMGMSIGIEQIVITAGALEALNLALQAVARPGDTIAIESPTFYGCLQAAERLGLHVVEIPTHPREGVDLSALERALAKSDIRACWFMTTLQHPTGATMPSEKKRELVRLLSRREIPLIEDDAYAELQFSSGTALPAKSFDRKGYVMHCGSFSKCLAPGYRLGWVAAGRYTREIARRKIESSLATSLPIQQGIAQMLRHGGYDGHLTKLRRRLAAQQAAALDSVRRHFPSGYRVAPPAGGYFLWIECASTVDSLEVHRLALDFGITIAPGPMFSARRGFRNYLRLNYGHPWVPAMDRAVERLGQILRHLSL